MSCTDKYKQTALTFSVLGVPVASLELKQPACHEADLPGAPAVAEDQGGDERAERQAKTPPGSAEGQGAGGLVGEQVKASAEKRSRVPPERQTKAPAATTKGDGSHTRLRGFGSSISEQIRLGSSPKDAEDLRRLKDAGVTAILNLQETSESPRPSERLMREFKWRRIPTKDSLYDGIPSQEWLDECVRQLEEWTNAGEKVYVHCQIGKGRSPLVVMAHLVLNEGMRLSRAIATTVRKRPVADPNVHQLVVLTRYVQERILEQERAEARFGQARQATLWLQPPERYDYDDFFPEDAEDVLLEQYEDDESLPF